MMGNVISMNLITHCQTFLGMVASVQSCAKPKEKTIQAQEKGRHYSSKVIKGDKGLKVKIKPGLQPEKNSVVRKQFNCTLWCITIK